MEKKELYFEPCEETLKRFKENSIDLIVTSPPYNIGKMHSNRLQFGSYANNDMKEANFITSQDSIEDRFYANGMKRAIAILESLKPTEREMFQDFASKRFYRNPKELNTKQYFNEYLTQD